MLRTSFLLQKFKKGSNSVLVTGLWFLHTAISFMTLYQCTKFQLLEIRSGQFFLLQKLMEVNTGDRVMVMAFCNSPYQCIKFHWITFNTFRDTLGTKVWRTDGRTDKAATVCLGSIKTNVWRTDEGSEGRTDRRMDGRTTWRLYALPSGRIKNILENVSKCPGGCIVNIRLGG